MVAGIELTIPKDYVSDESALLPGLINDDYITMVDGSILLPVMGGISAATPKERQQHLK